MSDLLSFYEDKFNTIMNQLRIITSSFATLSREKAESAITGGIALLKEGEDMLSQMESEISTNPNINSTFKMKVKNLTIDFTNIKHTFDSIQTKYINKKANDAIKLGIDDNNISSNHKGGQDLDLIPNENTPDEHMPNVLSDLAGKHIEQSQGNVDIAQQHNYFDVHGNKELDDTIPDENDLNVKIEQKNRKIIIIGIVVILLILFTLIGVLSWYINAQQNKSKDTVDDDSNNSNNSFT